MRRLPNVLFPSVIVLFCSGTNVLFVISARSSVFRVFTKSFGDKEFAEYIPPWSSFIYPFDSVVIGLYGNIQVGTHMRRPRGN